MKPVLRFVMQRRFSYFDIVALSTIITCVLKYNVDAVVVVVLTAILILMSILLERASK